MYTTDAVNVYHAKFGVRPVYMGSDIHSESKKNHNLLDFIVFTLYHVRA